ncbi:hypothetical protein ABIC45_004234 [Mucilaginibacter rubeus]|uniref:hypothetical protein n=1 Tax=Mucilaginibacter rubeus TaxID=2027860 RepID=UPI003398A447
MKTTNLNELLNSNVIALDDQAQNNIIGGLRTIGRRQSLNVDDLTTDTSAWSKFKDTVSAYWSQVFHS